MWFDCFVSVLCSGSHTPVGKMVKCRVLLLDGREFTCDVNVCIMPFPVISWRHSVSGLSVCSSVRAWSCVFVNVMSYKPLYEFHSALVQLMTQMDWSDSDFWGQKVSFVMRPDLVENYLLKNELFWCRRAGRKFITEHHLVFVCFVLCCHIMRWL